LIDEDEAEDEELARVIKKMLASGISMKKIQKTIGKESKQEKSRQRTLGKGRGRGGGRAKNK
jgi:DNA-binding transcriptional MerR regulator